MSDVMNAYHYGNHKKKFYPKHIFYFMDGVEKE